jgi:hypothetical protein
MFKPVQFTRVVPDKIPFALPARNAAARSGWQQGSQETEEISKIMHDRSG